MRLQFDSWVRKIPYRRDRLPTAVFLPGESLRTKESGGLQSMGSVTELGHDRATKRMHSTFPAELFGSTIHSSVSFCFLTCSLTHPLQSSCTTVTETALFTKSKKSPQYSSFRKLRFALSETCLSPGDAIFPEALSDCFHFCSYPSIAGSESLEHSMSFPSSCSIVLCTPLITVHSSSLLTPDPYLCALMWLKERKHNRAEIKWTLNAAHKF